MSNLNPRQLSLMAKARRKLLPTGGRPEMFWATVTATHSNPPTVDVKIGGSDATVPNLRYDRSYTPAVGDTVYGFSVDKDYFVAGARA